MKKAYRRYVEIFLWAFLSSINSVLTTIKDIDLTGALTVNNIRDVIVGGGIAFTTTAIAGLRMLRLDQDDDDDGAAHKSS